MWTQSNHFERPGISLTASVARIPWLTSQFRGFLVGLLLDGELHRFTTYNGSKIESLTLSETHLHLRIRNRTVRLEVESRKAPGAVLHAPYERQMIERTPLKRIGDVEDIAAGAVYLASAASGYVTGRCLDIDGGVRRSNLDMNIPDL